MHISNLHPVLSGVLEILNQDTRRRFVLCRDNAQSTWFAVDLDELDDLLKFYNTADTVAVAHLNKPVVSALVSAERFEILELNLTQQVQYHAPDPRRMDLLQYLNPSDQRTTQVMPGHTAPDNGDAPTDDDRKEDHSS